MEFWLKNGEKNDKENDNVLDGKTEKQRQMAEWGTTQNNWGD